MFEWFERAKEDIINFITNRVSILTFLFFGMGIVLVYRCFDLQIVNGQKYLDDFILMTEKTRDISSSRGSIYDRNGELLAYDELAYSVKIEDIFESGRGKNKKLNDTIYRLIQSIEKNGDKIITDFDIILDQNNQYSFNVEGTKLHRFLADVYGYASIDKMKEKDEELLNSTAEQVIDYLAGSKRYAIGDYENPNDSTTTFIPGKGYTRKELLQIVTIRYAMGLTSYRKYIGTTVATDVSRETVAVIMENSADLEGVSIVEDTVRRYTEDSFYFAHILGYTGRISADELESLNQLDREEGGSGERYTLNDMVGKSGIEQYMETTLQGVRGHEKVSVDNMGRVISILEKTDAKAGNDVHLTIDANLQRAAYEVLEQHIAGIVADKIINAKTFDVTNINSTSEIKIPINDVYYALIKNSIIDMNHFSSPYAGDTEKAVYEKYLTYKAEVYEKLEYEFFEKKTIYDKLTLEYQNYQSDIITLLKNKGILNRNLIDTNDSTQIAWATEEVISIHDYLKYCISKNWIDVSYLDLSGQYSDSEEIYKVICDFVIKEIDNNVEFQKKIYRFMIRNDVLSGKEVCEILCEQKAIPIPAEDEIALFDNKMKPYQFMMNRIRNLDVTPAQLALDPCNGSVVITDIQTGDVLALVTYPGYDNNKMANSIDPDYWNQLLSDKSNPMINYATYYSAAPGSTYKMVSATAALMENVVTLNTKVNCTGKFSLINPAPYCWKVSGHGHLDVSGAIANSCNYYFYNVGYQLSTTSGVYNASEGLATLEKYAAMYGLTEKTGIEIVEAMPSVSKELPVPSAIGQGSNSFTAVGLTRYVAAVANNGTSYNLTLLDSVTDKDGNVIKTYEPEVYNQLAMPQSYWDNIHKGMRTVVQKKSYFNELNVNVAGKTGTAEESERRPNHALFVGYAPYEEPEIAITARIPYGYSSDYAAQVTKDVIAYYYGLVDEEDVVTGVADELESGVSNNEI